MENNYRKNLIDTVRTLENTLDELNLNIINLAMAGEFSDFDAKCNMGEVMTFSINDFRNADDQNLKTCIELFDKIYQSYTSIMNVNAIKRKEIEGENTDEDLPF